MKLLSDFHNAILENDASVIIPAIKPHPRLNATLQFAVYSDGYRIRMVQSIRSDYPILLGFLGDPAFDNFARAYIEKCPPANYNLDFYPHKFAEFVRHNCDDDFAVEIAVLESAIAEVFMLPDSESFTTQNFKNISVEDFGETKLKLRTASRLLRFNHNINDWFTESRSKKNSSSPVAEQSWLLVIRHNNEVHRHNLSEQQYALLQNLANCKNISTAIDSTLDEQEFEAEIIINNLQSWFANWVTNGVFGA